MIVRLTTLCVALCFVSTAVGQTPAPVTPPATQPITPFPPATGGTIVPVWPDGKMPGRGAAQPEMHKPPAQNIDRVTNVSVPTLTIFKTPKTQGPAPAIIICPGGGYGVLAWDLEGTEVADWLNTLGITAIVLKYRVPGNRDGAFQDLQRACRLARAHATDWNIRADKLGVMGFSAGGHLTARLSNHYNEPAYPAIDDTDKQSCRPDFVMLVYPAYLATKDNSAIAPEMTVSAHTPVTLIVHTKDDKNYEPGSVFYDAALTAANVPHAFLLYDNGGHGWGLRSKRAVKVWPTDAAAWLHKIGVL